MILLVVCCVLLQATQSVCAAETQTMVEKTEITAIKSVSSNKVKLTWKKVDAAKSYEVYRSFQKEKGFQRVASLKGTTTTYVDKTVKSGKKYFYRVKVLGKSNGKKVSLGYSQTVSFRSLKQVNISSVKPTTHNALKVRWKKVNGATSYKIYRANAKRGTYKKIATVDARQEAVQSYTDYMVVSGRSYFYKVQACADKGEINSSVCGDQSSAKGGSTAYTIMGESTVTVNQMVGLFQSARRKYPSKTYKKKGAKDIKRFCEIVLEECKKEGVKAEVLFAQICLETGYLQFGGQVNVSQCNFGGLGATDDGANGATFPNVRIGIRAQVQHLKGYASKEALNQKCVDPRFVYLASRRGTAKYVQKLGNGNWATDPNYAPKLMNLIQLMKTY